MPHDWSFNDVIRILDPLTPKSHIYTVVHYTAEPVFVYILNYRAGVMSA